MLRQLRGARFARCVVIPTLLVIVSGCHKWVDIELGPSLPDEVRVAATSSPTSWPCPYNPTRHDRFKIQSPRLVGDSLYHALSADPIPISSVCSVEEQVGAPLATVGLVFGLFLVGGVIGLAMTPSTIGGE